MRRLSVTALTHRGAVRAGNEDTIGIANWSAHTDMDGPVQRSVDVRAPVACAVADGMGGHQGGSLASRFVISRLARESGRLSTPKEISEFVARIDADLIRLGAEQRFASPPGSTLAAALFQTDGTVTVFNVGDSRIYRVTGSSITRLSTDDTPDSANSDPDDMTGRRGHVLTQAIGGKRAPERMAVHIVTESPALGSLYLLCTDGLTDVVGTADLTEFFEKFRDEDVELVTALFDLALSRGGPDNISVCLVRPTD